MGSTSLVAERVAKEVLATLGAGKIPNIEKIAAKNGYSKLSARAGAVQETKTYQDIMARDKEETLKQLQRQVERNRLAIAEKDLSEEEYETLIKAQDTLIKNMQMLTGGKSGDEHEHSTQPIVNVVNFTAIQNNTVVNTATEKEDKQLNEG